MYAPLFVLLLSSSTRIFPVVYMFMDVLVCVCRAGGERAYEGGEGGGQIPPLQLSHQVHQHVGPQSGLFYWLVKRVALTRPVFIFYEGKF